MLEIKRTSGWIDILQGQAIMASYSKALNLMTFPNSSTAMLDAAEINQLIRIMKVLPNIDNTKDEEGKSENHNINFKIDLNINLNLNGKEGGDTNASS